MRVAILEPGAWGTALGIILSRRNKVKFWYENRKLALKINRSRNNEKLPEIKIPQKILISPDLVKTIQAAELIIIASPSFNLRRTLLKLKEFKNLPPLLGIAKGIEKETLKLPSQVIEEILGKIPYAHLSGPGFARQIIRGKPAEEVIASENRLLLKKIKELFRIKAFQILTTTDLIGVQLAGAVKNSLAIGISLTEVANLGLDNKQNRPELIKSGLKEMIELGKAIGAKEKTFLGPAGFGDLVLTSSDPLSRNFQFGKSIYLDADKMRQDIREGKITVEGFNNTWALYKLGRKYKVDLPMINEIYKVIYKKVPPTKTVKNLIKITTA
ncbi:hypothetical protein AMJ48_00345 [Parcubacteria bacterium DG_74_1]|nr:MAG: hypothetical protein AMJ48_00345 [Parcubacteria bacterium DG_74_1]